MSSLDWWVVALYLQVMLVGSWFLGRQQSSRDDYYRAGGELPNWTLATSIIATQCSTNSLLGAPAFVGFVIGGGMIWLQYELAVPLAMLLLCYLFVPLRESHLISIYSFLERRLGLHCRLLASGCFLFFRGIATGVTVYGVASVIELVSGISYFYAVMILMGITIAYDLLGGMKAVVLSDVVQMLLLIGAIVVGLVWLAGPLLDNFEQVRPRAAALVNDWGLQSGNDYGFWPMLFGGLFLYIAYYGCDQSQAQRLLSASDLKGTQRILLLNGLLRFPLVFCYCLLGLGLAVYAAQHSGFLESLPRTGSGEPNINLVFPGFVMAEFPPGLVGLVIVGIFAAAMSSVDSALNSLSASTVEDYLDRFRRLSEKQLFLASKVTTVAWGLFAVVFSFQVESIAPTVLEAINKIGSMANGPLLALFVLAMVCRQVWQGGVLLAFSLALLANLFCWLCLPDMSWLWWNPLGFGLCLILAFAFSRVKGCLVIDLPDLQASVEKHLIVTLLLTFFVILAICCFLQFL